MNTFESVSFINESYDIQVINEFAISKFIDKLKEIKNSKPDEYTKNDEVKKFVDKYHDDLIEVADILEKEPKNIRKSELKAMAGIAVAFIGDIIIALGASAESIVIMSIGGVGMALGVIATIVGSIIMVIRSTKDTDAANELNKIKTSLKKVLNNKGLEEDTKKKISKIITKINDAETEYSSIIKVQD